MLSLLDLAAAPLAARRQSLADILPLDPPADQVAQDVLERKVLFKLLHDVKKEVEAPGSGS